MLSMTSFEFAHILRLVGQSACYEAAIRRAIVALEFGNIAAALSQLRSALLVACVVNSPEERPL